MNKILNNLIENLKELYKERLVSVLLYGSCAVDECDTVKPDINSIVIIENMTGDDLEKAHSALKNWNKTGSPLPLFMDRDEWFNSLDVYPIEYSDIKERHKILYGEDIVASIKIEHKNLRHQCEYEVKNLLISLRQSYMAKCSDSKIMESLIKSSSKSFMALFRSILRLSNASVPHKHEEVIRLMAEKVAINKEMFLKILNFRKDSKVLNKKEYNEVIKQLIDSVNLILKYVDKLENQEV